MAEVQRGRGIKEVDSRTEIWDNVRQRKANRMSIQAVIYQDESGAYCAEVPAFPGCHSCGDTYEEALANIREAAQLWMDCVNEEVRGAPAGAELQRVAL